MMKGNICTSMLGLLWQAISKLLFLILYPLLWLRACLASLYRRCCNYVSQIVKRKYKLYQIRNLLMLAPTYDDYKALALKLDKHTGNDEWKKDRRSDFYDFQTVQTRLELLRGLSNQCDYSGLLLALRGGLRRNLAGIGSPPLHSHCFLGTKYLIEEYVAEVVKQLEFVCDAEIPDFDDGKKLEFFLETRQSYGRTALLLSGGATLGMYHFGVIKALFEQKLLPRIISGSSVGSLVAAIVCTRTDEELPDLFTGKLENTEVFESKQRGSLERKIQRFLTKGVLFDIQVLEGVMKQNLGEYTTFKEAFDRTGRILNIVVASTTRYEVPLLVNYLTHPNVLIWSAACASCALKGLYEPVELMAKDSSGKIRPYHPSGIKWSDGSVENDLPMMRLAELFNINHSIVSQVNPHVIPFLRPDKEGNKVYSAIKYLLESEVKHRVTQIAELGLFPNFMKFVQPLITQPYEGDITIVPNVELKDYLHIISNPTERYRKRCIVKGQRSAWHKIAVIKSHCDIELALEKCLNKVRSRLQEKDTPSYSSFLLRNIHNIHQSDFVVSPSPPSHRRSSISYAGAIAAAAVARMTSTSSLGSGHPLSQLQEQQTQHQQQKEEEEEEEQTGNGRERSTVVM